VGRGFLIDGGESTLNATADLLEGEPGSRKIGNRWGWWVCWFLFASTALSYMDRQAVAVVGERVKGEFHVDNEGFGWILAAFQLPYALFQVPAGLLADRGDVRRTYAAAVVFWSLAAIAVAWSPTLAALMLFRAALGLGESFNWPCALRVTATVLPPADRGLGNGIFNSGAAVGAVLTPLIVVPLTVWLGWRAAFALIGAAGLLWAVAWIVAVYGPARPLFDKESPADAPGGRLTGPALSAFSALVVASALITALGFGLLPAEWKRSAFWLGGACLMFGSLAVARMLPMAWLGRDNWAVALGEVVRLRRFWVLVVVSISINVCWHFLVNWLPTYLNQYRNMAFVTGSLLSAVPFLAADVGNLAGGAASRSLARRGLKTSTSRAVVLVGCVFLISAGAGVGAIRDNTVTVVLLSVMALGTAAFMANYFAYCQEVSERRTGLVVGILGGLGNLFAAGFSPIVGKIADRTGGFGPVFLIVGLLPFVGLGAILIGWRSGGPSVREWEVE
jgi:ACS family hexuronate transporter-like MFS transporter